MLKAILKLVLTGLVMKQDLFAPAFSTKGNDAEVRLNKEANNITKGTREKQQVSMNYVNEDNYQGWDSPISTSTVFLLSLNSNISTNLV